MNRTNRGVDHFEFAINDSVYYVDLVFEFFNDFITDFFYPF